MTDSTRVLPSRRTLLGGLAAAGALTAIAITSNGGVGDPTGGIGSLFGVTPQALDPSSIGPAGGSQPHENTQPFLCINFIISLFGVFPTQT